MTPAAEKWGEWLRSRGITLETAERNGLASQRVFSPAAGTHVDALVFPYFATASSSTSNTAARINPSGR